jgi:hypothetical protein
MRMAGSSTELARRSSLRAKEPRTGTVELRTGSVKSSSLQYHGRRGPPPGARRIFGSDLMDSWRAVVIRRAGELRGIGAKEVELHGGE